MRDQELAGLVEANSGAFLQALGRAGGAEERDDEQVRWTIGGSPIDYHNAVFCADLAASQVDVVIEQSIERMQAHDVPGSWHVGPGMRPKELGAALVAHGFRDDGAEPGMALELEQFNVAAGDSPAALQIERVTNEIELGIWEQTLAQGFGEGEREAHWVAAMYRAIGLGDNTPWRHLLGRLDGRPVATASIFYGAGVAGLYFVLTLEEARGQGIGAAITQAALGLARSDGYPVMVLGASRPGQRLYRRLGFRDVCAISLYTWT